MILLSGENISKSFDERKLLDQISFGISEGDKVAIVGANGAGKTTLLRILAGITAADTGKVSLTQGVSVEYLHQQPIFEQEQTIWQAVLEDCRNPRAMIVKQWNHAQTAENLPDGVYESLTEQIDMADAWDFESEASQIIGRLGLPDPQTLTSTLSGGQRKRLAIAQLILARPKLILLDEPTNHLDMQTIEWLENWLSAARVSACIITHDRYFLDKVCNKIIELDGGKLFHYQGNYAYFLEKKAERFLRGQASAEKARNLLTKELEWLRRQPKARGTKAKYRVDAVDDLKEKAKGPTQKADLEIRLGTSRTGSFIGELLGVDKHFGELPILKNFSYTFKKQDRLALIGPNGIGKSTFLNLLTSNTLPDNGEIRLGQTIKIGYYTQEVENLNLEHTLIEEVRTIAEYIILADGTQIGVSKLLEQFLFPPARQYTRIEKLSGGEKRRLQLLKVLAASPNLLILDEPTNDLDIDTLNVLEDYLLNFPGCLVLVSHDRYFTDRLVEHIFVFEGNGIVKDFHGNYTEYRQEQESNTPNTDKQNRKTNQIEAAANQTPKTQESKKKLSFKELKELETLEKEIQTIENQIKETNMMFESPESNSSMVQKWTKELVSMQQTLESKTTRWLALSELV